jgi:hypothetical protein
LLIGRRLYRWVEGGSEWALRHLHDSAFPGRGGERLPPLMLVTLPKAGSVYIHGALRRTLRVPMLKVACPGIHEQTLDHRRLAKFAKGNAVCREHFAARDFIVEGLRMAGIRKMVVHVRDPRAAILSWTRNMDRVLATAGPVGVILDNEQMTPGEYADWDFERRLEWQVDNHLPRYVAWIEGWMQLKVTTYEEFARDNRAFVEGLLRFFEIKVDPSWIAIAPYEVGRANIHNIEKKSLAEAMGARLYERATRQLPDALAERFHWPKDAPVLEPTA